MSRGCLPVLCLALFVVNFSLPPNLARAEEDADAAAIRKCLQNWGKHPFHSKNPAFRTVSAKVKVLGIGGDVVDAKETARPELVLVKPNVTVLGKSEIELLNPNGWYCMKTSVAVLGKSEVRLGCKSSLASSAEGVAVLGANDKPDGGGIAVLGSTRLKRVGCDSTVQ